MIDWKKPLVTNVPGEVAVPLNKVFAGRQLVQITEDSGSQGLYLASDDGRVHRLVVDQAHACASHPPVLKNKSEAIDVPEFFMNLYQDGEIGLPHQTLDKANSLVKNSGPTRRACVRIKIHLDENNKISATISHAILPSL